MNHLGDETTIIRLDISGFIDTSYENECIVDNLNRASKVETYIPEGLDDCLGPWTTKLIYTSEQTGEEIYQAHSESTGNDYIMKSFNLETSDVEDIIQEIDFQNQVAVEGLAPQLYQLVVSTQNISFIMAGLKETALNRLIRYTKTGDTASILKLIKNICDCTQLLHKIGIQHGDTHFENFMFDDEDSLMIIDFGQSSEFDKLSYVNDFVLINNSFAEFTTNLGDDKQLIQSISDDVYKLIKSYIPAKYRSKINM